MDLNIGTQDPKVKILWEEIDAVRAAGGFSLADTLPSATTYLLKGAPINVNYTSRVATLIKTVAIVGGTTAAPQITTGHMFKVGDFISDGVVAKEISVITATTTTYDTLTFTSGTLSTAVVGTVLYQTDAVAVASGAAALATVQDTAGDFLVATADISATGANWNNVSLTIEQAGDDVLAIAFAAGVLTISLAKTTAANNNIAAIQALVDAMGTIEGYDMTELTFSGTDWDDKQTGTTLTTPTDLFDGGVNQVAPIASAIANSLLSDNTKIAGTPTVTAVISAKEIQELNLSYPVNADIKAALNSNGQYFQFV
jgi:hypothetical protein